MIETRVRSLAQIPESTEIAEITSFNLERTILLGEFLEDREGDSADVLLLKNNLRGLLVPVEGVPMMANWMTFTDSLAQGGDDSREVGTFKDWARCFLIPEPSIQRRIENPRQKGAVEVSEVLLGMVTKPEEVKKIYNSILFDKSKDLRIPEQLSQAFVSDSHLAHAVANFLRPYFMTPDELNDDRIAYLKGQEALSAQRVAAYKLQPSQ